MKRFWFVILVLTALSSNAAARRMAVDESEEFVAYAETDTIERSSSAAKMSVLYDYKIKHTYLKWGYWSQRALNEFDCKERRSQVLYYAFYSGQMGGGELILNGPVLPGLWAPVRAGTTLERLWKIACGS